MRELIRRLEQLEEAAQVNAPAKRNYRVEFVPARDGKPDPNRPTREMVFELGTWSRPKV